MIKKSVSVLLILLLIFNLVVISAEEDAEDLETDQENGESEVSNSDDSITINEEDSERAKTLKAYNCFRDRVNDKCSSLGLDDLIFTSLITAECKKELIDKSNNQECWPSSCEVKKTAQALIALEELSLDTEKTKDWLLTQTTFPQEMIWYLQIDSNKETTCSITYEGATKSITISEDKKISSNAGPCLTLAEGNYWLKVSENCYDKEFEISCSEDFLTNLLYRKKTSQTIYVPESIQISSAGGSTTEKINSLCFKKGTSCDYESSLWATFALDQIGEDVEKFIPYLTAMAEDNDQYLPSSFLYLLTNHPDFYVTLSESQAGTKYWDTSGDKFYDTGIALLGLQKQDSTEKQNSINWLLSIQKDDGCWETTIKNSALILYAAFPRQIEKPIADEDCVEAGKYCVSSSILCKQAEGDILRGYKCPGVKVCCSVPEKIETCSNLGGTICNENEKCVGSKLADTEDLSFGETCCQGNCEAIIPIVEPECEEKNIGYCRTSCFSDEEEKTGYDCNGLGICCAKKTNGGGGLSWLWIILLIFLILLVILAIIFRDKLRPFWMRLKSKFTKRGSSQATSSRPGFPPRPGFSPSTRPPMTPRRIIPSASPRPSSIPRKLPIKQKTNDELSDVLKKLKDMSS